MKILKKNIVINSRKFDKSIQRSWKADLIKKQNSLMIFVGIFEQEVNHPFLGFIRRETISYEYYWLDGWFNVFRFHEPDGEFRNFYCNLNLPPVYENGILDYIDLDIDIIVSKDFSYTVLDTDEFEANAVKYNYSEELKSTVEFHLKNLIKKIQNRDFPFDYNQNLTCSVF